jgi:hypothetical protein
VAALTGDDLIGGGGHTLRINYCPVAVVEKQRYVKDYLRVEYGADLLPRVS